jgi:hypothetical protein
LRAQLVYLGAAKDPLEPSQDLTGFLSGLDAGMHALADQTPLEFGGCAQNVQQETTGWVALVGIASKRRDAASASRRLKPGRALLAPLI